MKDFTLSAYKGLLVALQGAGYETVNTNGLGERKTLSPDEPSPVTDNRHEVPIIMMRHDVDLRPQNSLATAQLEAELGIGAVYYFRAVPESWDEDVIRSISALGHEIGYHYESLTTCKGDVDAAWQDFCQNLERLRALAPVTSICMHGSPRSPYDSKDIWKKYDYHELGITFEPYIDTDFSQVFYLTDTGRRWDGYKVSVRDRIPQYQEKWTEQGLVYHSTDDIIRAAKAGTLPRRLMITTHPQRWNPFGPAWVKELVLQSAKNIIKRLLIILRNK